MEYCFDLEQAGDGASINDLHDRSFGLGRFERGVWILRSSLLPLAGLCRVARLDGQVVGSIRFTAVNIAQRNGVLLGPLAIQPEHRGRGCGTRLIRETLDSVASAGYPWVVLSGDEGYYSRFGFCRVPGDRISVRGPVAPLHILLLEIVPGVASELSGEIVPGHIEFVTKSADRIDDEVTASGASGG